ncbi:uncharacterized protein LOC141668273 [Apium graveolens]|uniref:uncharacterized protein LOC141668273 n=1 Tax=Apium graveolens TaxID=4045 RepID=UPI003D7A5696
MGGHGGLNILPQKRWNVYNFDNREKVRKDEEAAAKEEQLKREQSRKRDTELRLEQLRQARGVASSSKSELKAESITEVKSEEKSKNNHINLFEGIKIFDPIEASINSFDDDKRGRFKQLKREAKKLKKESEEKVVAPEDEKYKLGYGLVGKGVKMPWYMSKKARIDKSEEESDEEKEGRKRSGGGKKTIEEMREERLKRERRERERVKALLSGKGPRDGPDYKDRYYTKRRA